MDEARQTAAAEKIYNLIPVWDRDDTKTDAENINDIFNMISADPVTPIEYLLNIIGDLNA